jgi:hypothetical protein
MAGHLRAGRPVTSVVTALLLKRLRSCLCCSCRDVSSVIVARNDTYISASLRTAAMTPPTLASFAFPFFLLLEEEEF